MNTSKLILIGFLCLVMIPQVAAQENISKAKMTGEWHFDFGKSKSEMSSNAVEMMAKMSVENKQRIEGAYKDRILRLHENDEFELQINPNRIISGNWSIDQGNQPIIRLTLANGETMQMLIDSLSESKLVLKSMAEQELGTPYFPIWHFTKQ